MRAPLLPLAALAPLFMSATPPAQAMPATEFSSPLPGRTHSGGDVTGWHDIHWGMTVDDVITHYGGALTVQETKTSLDGCFVRYAVPIRLLDEEWAVWLCEAPDQPVVVAMQIESENGSTSHFERFLSELTSAYGPAHAYWNTCHNVRWNGTEKYTWSFRSTKVSLVNRDVTVPWVVFRYERHTGAPDFGPGVCTHPPVDLRATQ